jgi:V/A-type H+-transporting ATPase subunit K
MQARLWTAVALSGGALLLAMVASLILWAPIPALAQTAAEGAEAAGGGGLDPAVVRWGLASAAAATGLSTLGAGYAVAVVGSAGVGALAEKPELMGRVLVLVGLAEGIAIYGLIVAILILNRVAA